MGVRVAQSGHLGQVRALGWHNLACWSRLYQAWFLQKLSQNNAFLTARGRKGVHPNRYGVSAKPLEVFGLLRFETPAKGPWDWVALRNTVKHHQSVGLHRQYLSTSRATDRPLEVRGFLLYRRKIPRSRATVTAAVRSSTPSLAKACSRWVLTVASEILRLRATSLLE